MCCAGCMDYTGGILITPPQRVLGLSPIPSTLPDGSSQTPRFSRKCTGESQKVRLGGPTHHTLHQAQEDQGLEGNCSSRWLSCVSHRATDLVLFLAADRT